MKNLIKTNKDLVLDGDNISDLEFQEWVLILLKQLNELRIMGMISNNDAMNLLFSKDDGMDLEWCIKAVENGDEDGMKILKILRERTELEVALRKLGKSN